MNLKLLLVNNGGVNITVAISPKYLGHEMHMIVKLN